MQWEVGGNRQAEGASRGPKGGARGPGGPSDPPGLAAVHPTVEGKCVVTGRERDIPEQLARAQLLRGPAREAAEARRVSGRPKRCKLAHAFLREYSYKRLQLAQLLGQLGVSHLGGGRVAGAALGADAVRPHDALDVRGVLACTRNSQGWPRILITSVTKSNRDFRSNCCMGQLANFGPTHCAFQDLHI